MKMLAIFPAVALAACGGMKYQCVNENGITVAEIAPQNVQGIPGESLAEACAAIVARGEPSTVEMMNLTNAVMHWFSSNPVLAAIAVLFVIGLAGGMAVMGG